MLRWEFEYRPTGVGRHRRHQLDFPFGDICVDGDPDTVTQKRSTRTGHLWHSIEAVPRYVCRLGISIHFDTQLNIENERNQRERERELARTAMTPKPRSTQNDEVLSNSSEWNSGWQLPVLPWWIYGGMETVAFVWKVNSADRKDVFIRIVDLWEMLRLHHARRFTQWDNRVSLSIEITAIHYEMEITI